MTTLELIATPHDEMSSSNLKDSRYFRLKNGNYASRVAVMQMAIDENWISHKYFSPSESSQIRKASN
jgi:hypothetical protein